MNKQVPVTIHLFLKLAVADVTHVQDSHALRLLALKSGQVSLPSCACVVLSNVVHEGLDGVVVVAAHLAPLPLTAVRGLVFSHVASVAAAKVTLGAFEVVSSVLAHMSVQVALGIGGEITLVTGEWLQVRVY